MSKPLLDERVVSEKEHHERLYVQAYETQASFNFQVPSIWLDKAANPSPKPLDYWEYAFHLLGDLHGKTVAEIGCGDGWLTVCLASAGASVFAFDVSYHGCVLTRAKAQAHGLSDRVSVATMDSHSMAFPDSSFDAVWIAGVLHHMDINRMAREIHRILKPGGRVVCQEPLNYGPIMWAIRQLWLRLNGLKEYNETEYEEFFDGEEDFAAFEKAFRTAHVREFNFIAKTNRLRKRFGWFADLLRWADYLVLTYVPFFRRYCTCIVCCYEK